MIWCTCYIVQKITQDGSWTLQVTVRIHEMTNFSDITAHHAWNHGTENIHIKYDSWDIRYNEDVYCRINEEGQCSKLLLRTSTLRISSAKREFVLAYLLNENIRFNQIRESSSRASVNVNCFVTKVSSVFILYHLCLNEVSHSWRCSLLFIFLICSCWHGLSHHFGYSISYTYFAIIRRTILTQRSSPTSILHHGKYSTIDPSTSWDNCCALR